MPTFYFDTSALAKRYREEKGSRFIDKLFQLLEKPQNRGATSFLTFLELLAMIGRLLKGKQITQESYNRTLARILHDLNLYFSISPLSTSILARSVDVIKRHSLKAPDAQQLAAALELEPILEQLNQRLIFIVDDDDLHEAAEREGLEAVNPREKGALKRLQQLAKGR